jgi:hypothetical protein
MSKKNYLDEIIIEQKDELISQYPLCIISGNMIKKSVKGKECNHIQGFSKKYLINYLSE